MPLEEYSQRYMVAEIYAGLLLLRPGGLLPTRRALIVVRQVGYEFPDMWTAPT